MSTDVVTNITDVEITKSPVDLTVSGDLSVCVENKQEITVQKNEYSIVGDALYARVSVGEAPEWLTAIIDSVIDLQLAGSLANLSDLRNSIIQSLAELDIAKNQYQELINIEQTIDSIITSRLTTLNANLDQANANIITLQLTAVTPTMATAIAADQISASLNGGSIGSAINNVNTVISTLDETVANMYTSLTSAIDGVGEAISEVEVTANVLKDRLEASWSYNAKLLLADGKWYRSGFGLNTSVATGGDGSEANPYQSEFWINAQRFKFTNSGMTGTVTPFTIDASGSVPAITFTGNVVINNRGTAVPGGLPVFLGNFATAPVAQVKGDTYKNIANGIVYTWDGSAWVSTAGADGKGVSSTVVTYQVSSSGTVAPEGTWLTTVPTVPEGQFLWTRTVFTYTDNTTITTYSVAKQGVAGANGTDGVGIASSQIHYQVSTSGTVIPTGAWLSSIPSVPAGQYLWTRTTLTFTNSTVQYSYSVSRQGLDGSNGATGSRGPGFFRIATPTGAWADSTAASAVPGGVPVKDDIVTIYQIGNPAVATTKMYTGTAWAAPALAVHGNMVVDGTIAGQKLIIGTIQGQHLENGNGSAGITAVKFNDWLRSDATTGGQPVLGLNFRTGDAYLRNVYARGDIEASSLKAGNVFVGNTIQSSNFNPANPTQAGWQINANGSATFNGVVITRPNVVASGTYTGPFPSGYLYTSNGVGGWYGGGEKGPIVNTFSYKDPTDDHSPTLSYELRDLTFFIDIPRSSFTPTDVGTIDGKLLIAQAFVLGSIYYYTGADPGAGGVSVYDTICEAHVSRVSQFTSGQGGSYIRLRIVCPLPLNIAARVYRIEYAQVIWSLSQFS